MEICRVCGHDSDLPNSYESLEPYADIYVQLTAVQFHGFENPQLLKICVSCIEKLQSFDEFRNNCLGVHWKIKNVKDEPEDQHLDDGEASPDETIEPFETVSLSIKAEFIPEPEDIEPPAKKPRVKKGSLKKQSPLQLACDRCPEIFQEITLFNAHKRIHDGLLPFVCETCQLDFGSLLDLKLHIVQSHTEDKSFPCDHPGCDEIFSSHQGLRRHRLRVHDPNYTEPEQSSYICEICANSYTSKHSLNRHRYSHSPNEMPNACSFCPRRFSSLHSLKQHMNRHNGIKNHMCPYCGVRKTTRNELRSHLKNIHSKEQPLVLNLESLNAADNQSEGDTPSEPKKTVSQGNWKRTVRKQNRNSGKAYVSSNNVMIPGKSFPENFDCSCPKRCPSLFSSQSVPKQFFNSYWELGDWHRQNIFLQEMVKSVEVARRRSRSSNESARSRTVHYFIPDGTERVRVCKKYFLGILQIGWGRVYRRVVNIAE